MGEEGETERQTEAPEKLNKTEQNWYVFQFLTARVMKKENEQGEMGRFGTIFGRAPGSAGAGTTESRKQKTEIWGPEYTRVHQNPPKPTKTDLK